MGRRSRRPPSSSGQDLLPPRPRGGQRERTPEQQKSAFPIAIVNTTKRHNLTRGNSSLPTDEDELTVASSDVSPFTLDSESMLLEGENVQNQATAQLGKFFDREATDPEDKSSSKGGRSSRRERHASKHKRTSHESKSSGRDKLGFLLTYEAMVRAQDVEDAATTAHLLPVFGTLRYIGGDTAVKPARRSLKRRSSKKGGDVNSVGSSSSGPDDGSLATFNSERTDEEKAADAMSYLTSYSNKVERDDGTVLSFEAMEAALKILRGKDDQMTLDRSLMLLLSTLVEANAKAVGGVGTAHGSQQEEQEEGITPGVTFAEFMQAYKTVGGAMLAMQRFAPAEERRRTRTRDRAQGLIESLVAGIPRGARGQAGLNAPAGGEGRGGASARPRGGGMAIALACAIAALVAGEAAWIHGPGGVGGGVAVGAPLAGAGPPQEPVPPARGDGGAVDPPPPLEEGAIDAEAGSWPVRPRSSREHFELRKLAREAEATGQRWRERAWTCQSSLASAAEAVRQMKAEAAARPEEHEEPNCGPEGEQGAPGPIQRGIAGVRGLIVSLAGGATIVSPCGSFFAM